MMRRIQLLPESYLKRQRERRSITMILLAGLLVLLLLLVWWVKLGFDVNSANDELASIRSQNQILEAQIAELRQFEELQAEVNEKQAALVAVMTGDIDWPLLLTEVAMATPGEVWLTSLTASAGNTEGSAPVPTESAPIRESTDTASGRIAFSGTSLSMPGIAKWLIRQEVSKRFQAIFLNDATLTTEFDSDAFDFQSTLELNEKALSERFLGDLEEEQP
jgi:Tfp pilus assembly protein PilN